MSVGGRTWVEVGVCAQQAMGLTILLLPAVSIFGLRFGWANESAEIKHAIYEQERTQRLSEM